MAFYRFIFWCPVTLVMVLSCSLHNFLSLLGIEIRLGLCKRIFYFSFFLPWPPPPFFSMFDVQNDLFWKFNWIFVFFSVTTAFFFFFAMCYTADVYPMDFNSRELWKCPFWTGRGRKSLFLVTLTICPGQPKFSAEIKIT